MMCLDVMLFNAQLLYNGHTGLGKKTHWADIAIKAMTQRLKGKGSESKGNFTKLSSCLANKDTWLTYRDSLEQPVATSC